MVSRSQIPVFVPARALELSGSTRVLCIGQSYDGGLPFDTADSPSGNVARELIVGAARIAPQRHRWVGAPTISSHTTSLYGQSAVSNNNSPST